MFRIKIESVGNVEVLSSSSHINGECVVLVDLGDGVRDRFVTWRIGYRQAAACKVCGRRIHRESSNLDMWFTQEGRTWCSNDGPRHEPTSLNGVREYHAWSGTYHSQRMNAERDFEKRASFRHSTV